MADNNGSIAVVVNAPGFPQPLDAVTGVLENTLWGRLTLQSATAADTVLEVEVNAPYRYTDDEEQLGAVSLDGPMLGRMSRPDFLHQPPTRWPISVEVDGAGARELLLRYEDEPHILARDDKSYVAQVLIYYETEDDE